jgi:hypothetical protein
MNKRSAVRLRRLSTIDPKCRHTAQSRIVRSTLPLAGSEPSGLNATDVTASLDVVSFGELAVADEGGGDAGEGEEVFGFAFVAAVESAADAEP